jgi:hypothetical protein
MVSVPPHVAVPPLGAVRPAGNRSVNARLLNAILFELVSRKLRLVVPFKRKLAAPKDLTIVGTATVTLKVAVAGVVFGPELVVVTPPAGIVFVTAGPGVVDVTLTVTTQLPLGGIVPPVRLTEVAV